MNFFESFGLGGLFAVLALAFTALLIFLLYSIIYRIPDDLNPNSTAFFLGAVVALVVTFPAFLIGLSFVVKGS